MKHLMLEDYLSILGTTNDSKNVIYNYTKIYNEVIKTWETPEDWIVSTNKIISVGNYNSNSYWIVWSMYYHVKLTIDFIKSIRVPKTSLNILKHTLEDWDVLDEALKNMTLYWANSSVSDTISKVLLICIFLGKNSVSEISLEEVEQASKLGVLKMDKYTKRVTNLIKFIKNEKDEEFKNHIQRQIRNYKCDTRQIWSNDMEAYINLAIKDKLRKSISFDKMYSETRAALDFFATWYVEYLEINIIEDLLKFERICWLAYINYLNNIKDISNKTKNSKAKVVKDFISWAKIKQPEIISDKKVIYNQDLDILKEHYSSKNLAFSSRRDAEIILRYIINEFVPKDLMEQYYKELIIIAANSGARIGELKLLEYGSVIYSEDEGLYKTILKYPDKLKQVNRPIYFTIDGYESIKRVEKLRTESGELVKRYDKRANREMIRLFEYNGGNGFLKTSLYSFIASIKRKLGLVDENGDLAIGNMHAFRHFFAMTVFVESNYNISVVRYLLGHKSYNMSFKYLEEEKHKKINMLRMNESENKIKISGKGLDTFINIILSNSNELSEIKSMIDSNSTLHEILKNKKIRKISLGYCLNPCEEKKGCVMCNNFLLTNEDEDELINSTNDLFELLCYKILLFNNLSEALEDINIQKDLNELLILVGELISLGINKERLSEDLKGLIACME